MLTLMSDPIPRSARDDKIMPSYPSTPTSDAVETLHGETIPDPYRWLEDGESPGTQEWTEAQNALTRSYLDGVRGREDLHRRLGQLLAIGAISVPTPTRGRYFYQRRDGRGEATQQGRHRPRADLLEFEHLGFLRNVQHAIGNGTAAR